MAKKEIVFLGIHLGWLITPDQLEPTNQEKMVEKESVRLTELSPAEIFARKTKLREEQRRLKNGQQILARH